MVGKTRNRCGYLLIGCDKYLATSYRQLLSYAEFALVNSERNLLKLTVIPLLTLSGVSNGKSCLAGPVDVCFADIPSKP